MERVRVIFEQPALPAFRVATYARLAAHPNLDFQLVHGVDATLPNVTPRGFSAREARYRSFHFGHEGFIWQPEQIRLSSRAHADVLLLTWNSRYLSLVPALLKARITGVPTILFGHGYSRTRGDRFAFLRNAIARLSTCVLVYNDSAAAALVKKGMRPERVFVATNSIDQDSVQLAVQHWTQDRDRLARWQKDNDLANSPFILFVSRLTPKTRLDLLIEGFAAALRRRPDLKLVIIGSGDDSAVKKHAERLGVLKSVRFIGAIYDEQSLAPYFLSARLLIYPAAIGLSIIHAYSYGLPVVTDDDMPNHNPEIEAMRDGENGLLYRAGDTDSMATQMLRIVDDPSFRQRLAVEAHRTAYERFSLQGNVNGYLRAIEYCLRTTGREVQLLAPATPPVQVPDPVATHA